MSVVTLFFAADFVSCRQQKLQLQCLPFGTRLNSDRHSASGSSKNMDLKENAVMTDFDLYDHRNQHHSCNA